MSRPARTIPPPAAIARWRPSSAARTSGTRDTAETAASTSPVWTQSVASCAVEQDPGQAPRAVIAQRDAVDQRDQRRGIVRGHALAQGERGQGAIQEAGVDEPQAETLGGGRPDAALAARRRPVEGDDDTGRRAGRADLTSPGAYRGRASGAGEQGATRVQAPVRARGGPQ